MSVVQNATSQDKRTLGSPPYWLVVTVWVLSSALVLVGLAGAVFGAQPFLLFIAVMAAALQLLGLRGVRAWYGRIDVDRDGVTATAGRASAVIPWDRVAAIEVTPPSWLGRVVGVRTQGAKRAKALPAPRVGVFGSRARFDADVAELVSAAPDTVEIVGVGEQGRASRRPIVLRTASVTMFVLVAIGCVAAGLLILWATQPWNTPMWPWRYEAVTTPQACGVVDQALVQGLVVAAADTPPEGSGSPGEPTTSCTWASPDDHEVRQSLSLTVRRETQTGWSSATQEAVDAIRIYRDGDARQPPYEAVAGVGDEAWVSASLSPADINPGVRVLARRANVWVDVLYAADLDADPVARYRADAIEAARAALRAVELR